MSLTKKQRVVLASLDHHWLTDVETLSTRTGQPREGAAATASSLIRKGLAERMMGGTGRPPHVHYFLTDAGREQQQAQFRREGQRGNARACRSCGCDDDHACEGGCSWAEPYLCDACAPIGARR